MNVEDVTTTMIDVEDGTVMMMNVEDVTIMMIDVEDVTIMIIDVEDVTIIMTTLDLSIMVREIKGNFVIAAIDISKTDGFLSCGLVDQGLEFGEL
ncbi:hypothetical protein DTX80_12605 [Bacilli bacterium]|nr:hypothetical protein WH51_03545 [Bacilli bacterium VT-13-104]PZD83471.1 hypothetical protein DEJ64_14650 [Bacilli bacterium]PZD84653.1 hypothetical protein DEJ60_14080 [Bacilli bacterium]PZD86947.1 hypothetical protein DEJ66_14590 [Bacilli bacterium]RCO05246.1 hypothetical protein DTX80_12605 [Bacilli bacterium]